MKVAILMSTYNGSKYIKEQIDSILNQDFDQWDLYIRDDFSKDDTVTIIEEYVNNYPNIHLIESENNVGAAKSFLLLLQAVEADYYMFCDQDDIWLKEKVSLSVEEIKKIETKSNTSIPALVFSDSKVVDSNLIDIHHSFWEYNKSNPQLILNNPEFINVFNCAPGCTMILNSDLKKLLHADDDQIIMHDWYAMLIALKTGKVAYINKALMLYRQHSDNVIGADDVSFRKNLNKIFKFNTFLRNQLSVYRFVSKYTDISIVKFYLLKLKFNSLRF